MQTKNLITTAIHTTNKTILAALTVICTIILMTDISYAQVTNPNGNYHFKNSNQRIYGDGNNVFEYHSNNSSNRLTMRLYDGYGELMGGLFGGEGGFGLTDKTGQWSYSARDNSTIMYVNGHPKMIIMSNSDVGIGNGGGIPNADLQVGPRLTMSSVTHSEGGWVGNNISRDGTSFKRIFSGTTADMSFTQDGRIIFRTSGYGSSGTDITDFRHSIEILNAGGVNIDGGLNLTSISNTKSSTGKSILRNQVHPTEDGYEFFSIQVNSKHARGFHVDESGRAVIGTNDPCQVIDINDTETRFIVDGEVLKTGAPFVTGTSDKRLKKNIAPMGESLNKLMKVKLYGYQYKKSGLFRYGVMPQEMQDVFPHSVGKMGRSKEEYLTFNPNNLIFTGLKATQEIGELVLEQQRQIKTLEVVNEELTTELIKAEKERNELRTELDAIKAALAGYGVNPPRPTDAEAQPISAYSTVHINTESNLPQLQQNIPNPFQQFTTIPYYLPEDARSATLLIQDMTGKTISKHTLSAQKGEGKIQVNISNVQLRGNYTYSLYVNEQHVDTKKMTLMTE